MAETIGLALNESPTSHSGVGEIDEASFFRLLNMMQYLGFTLGGFRE